MRSFLLAGLVLFGSAALAQPPQQCVNPRNVNGLVFLGRSDMKVSVTRSLASFMNGFRAPAGFSLIGTGVVQGVEAKVAYKTALGGDKAYAAMLAAMGAEGWAIETMSGEDNTFRAPSDLREGTLCRNGERRLMLVADSSDTTYVSIHNVQQPRHHECNTPDPGSELVGAGLNAMPRFRFPAGTSIARSLGGGGSNDSFTMSTRIISGDTPGKLVEHVADQMVEQGWQPDSSWSGSRSAGSTWSKRSDGGITRSMLEIIRVSDRTFDVDFTQTQ